MTSLLWDINVTFPYLVDTEVVQESDDEDDDQVIQIYAIILEWIKLLKIYWNNCLLSEKCIILFYHHNYKANKVSKTFQNYGEIFY
jgi:hypothetical protein